MLPSLAGKFKLFCQLCHAQLSHAAGDQRRSWLLIKTQGRFSQCQNAGPEIL